MRKIPATILTVSLSAALIAIASWLFPSSSLAHNPQIHFCVSQGGEFNSYPRGSDDLGVCSFGQAKINAISMIPPDAPATHSIAAQVILNDVVNASCKWIEPISSKDFCFFEDGSALSDETRRSSWSHPDRQRLKQALSTR